MSAARVQLLLAATLWMMPHMGAAAAAVLSSSTELLNITGAGTEIQPDFRMLTRAVSASRSRRKRAISTREINALLDFHNRVRSQVFPPAANMEHMVREIAVISYCFFIIKIFYYSFSFLILRRNYNIKLKLKNVFLSLFLDSTVLGQGTG